MPNQPGHVERHDPNAIQPYGLTWADYLDTGETITASSWAVASGTATIADAASGGTPATTANGTFTDTTTTVWVRSATAGVVTLRNRITTSAGRQDDRTHVALRVTEL